MICIKLPTIYIVDKNNNIYEYVVEDGINLEQINEFVKREYSDNFKEIRLGITVGYLKKEKYNK